MDEKESPERRRRDGALGSNGSGDEGSKHNIAGQRHQQRLTQPPARRERQRQRAEQRRMTVAPAGIEAVMQADREYFARHPERKFYVRRVHTA
jgi:hypothetical protein